MQRILGAAVVCAVMLATAGSAQAEFVAHPADFTYGTTKKQWVTSFIDEAPKAEQGGRHGDLEGGRERDDRLRPG